MNILPIWLLVSISGVGVALAILDLGPGETRAFGQRLLDVGVCSLLAFFAVLFAVLGLGV